MTIFRSKPYSEFEPTQDPVPWVDQLGHAWSSRERDEYALRQVSYPWFSGMTYTWTWKPRREQYDTPVNNLLLAFRKSGKTAWEFLNLLDQPDWVLSGASWTPNMARHARKVLTRLANLTTKED